VYESCQHTEKLDDRRIYCETEARDPAGDVAVVTDLLDELLYEKGEAGSDMYELVTMQDAQMVRRVVSYVLRPTVEPHGLPVRVELDMSLLHDKRLRARHFDVDVSWYADGSPENGRYVTSYYMGVFPDERVITSVDEPELGRIDAELNVVPARGRRHERPMTGYDFMQLFNELGIIYDNQQAGITGT